MTYLPTSLVLEHATAQLQANPCHLQIYLTLRHGIVIAVVTVANGLVVGILPKTRPAALLVFPMQSKLKQI